MTGAARFRRPEIVGEQLAAVDMPAEHGAKASGDVLPADDVGPAAEGIVAGSDARPLDGLVHAEQAAVCGGRSIAGLAQQVGETVADAPGKGKADQGHAAVPARVEEGPRPVKDVDVGMRRPEMQRDARALVVAGDDVDRGSGFGDADEGDQGQLDQGRRHPASIE